MIFSWISSNHRDHQQQSVLADILKRDFKRLSFVRTDRPYLERASSESWENWFWPNWPFEWSKAMSTRIRKFPLWRAFSKIYGYGRKIRWIRVDASRIRKKKFAFSQISGYVWTGPKTKQFAKHENCVTRYLMAAPDLLVRRRPAQLVEHRTSVRRSRVQTSAEKKHSGSLNNWVESAAFVITPSNG